MIEHKEKSEFVGIVTESLSCLSGIVSAGILPRILESTTRVMNTIDHRLAHVERRIVRKLYSFAMITGGGLFLLFSFFFLLTEYFGLSNAFSFFSIGLLLCMIGLMLTLGESDVR